MVAVRSKMGGTEALQRAIVAMKSKKLRVGWFETARYQDGTPVAYVAAIQEFGHGAIPPRPFMRPTIAQQRHAWRDTLSKGAKQVLAERLTFEQMLTAFGMSAAGNVAEGIKAVTAPPLSPATIAARQAKKKTPGVSDKPLIDTALMFQSVTAQVSDE